PALAQRLADPLEEQEPVHAAEYARTGRGREGHLTRAGDGAVPRPANDTSPETIGARWSGEGRGRTGDLSIFRPTHHSSHRPILLHTKSFRKLPHRRIPLE